jgi:hypothetical protein
MGRLLQTHGEVVESMRSTPIATGVLLRLASLPVLICALALAACGTPASALSRARATPPVTSTTAPVSKQATPAGTSPIAPGPVSLSASQARYNSADAITVSVHNGLASPIFAQDNHTGCTIVQLELASSGDWQGVGACVNWPTHPHMVEISSGQSMMVYLRPATEANLDSGWPSGMYRATLTYITGNNEPIDQGTTVVSQSFAIG